MAIPPPPQISKPNREGIVPHCSKAVCCSWHCQDEPALKSGNQGAGSQRKEKWVWLNPTKPVLSQIYIQRQSCQQTLQKERTKGDLPRHVLGNKSPTLDSTWDSWKTVSDLQARKSSSFPTHPEEGSVPDERTLYPACSGTHSVAGWPRTQEIPL